jgi:hypothetical protein
MGVVAEMELPFAVERQGAAADVVDGESGCGMRGSENKVRARQRREEESCATHDPWTNGDTV